MGAIWRIVALTASLTASSAAATERFVIFGDLQDTSPQGRQRDVELIERINKVEPAFSVFIGDIKGGDSRCTDDLFDAMRAIFDRHISCLLYTSPSPRDS